MVLWQPVVVVASVVVPLERPAAPMRRLAVPHLQVEAIMLLIRGWIWLPFLFPLFGFGGGFGGLFTILIFLAIANFLVQSFRRVGGSDDASEVEYSSNPPFQLPVYKWVC